MKKTIYTLTCTFILIILATCSSTSGASVAAPISTEKPTTGYPMFSFDGVNLALDPAIASGASGEVVASQSGEGGAPYWGIYPEYRKVTLSGYPVIGSNYQPLIAVYPVEAYRQLSQQSSQEIDNLVQALAQKSANLQTLPFLPLQNAKQSFHSNVSYIPFMNGNGVRYLVMYSQGIVPVNNMDLFYSYQGLTTDQKYLVSMMLPVNYPTLPARYDSLTDTERLKLIQDPTYFEQLSQNFSAQPSSSFSPDLEKLDALVQSIHVGQ
jgi:hypothetical protein